MHYCAARLFPKFLAQRNVLERRQEKVLCGMYRRDNDFFHPKVGAGGRTERHQAHKV